MSDDAHEKMLASLRRWGTSDMNEADSPTAQIRERRGTVTLSASIRSAQQQRTRQRKRLGGALAVAALAALAIGWAFPKATALRSLARLAQVESGTPSSVGEAKGSSAMPGSTRSMTKHTTASPQRGLRLLSGHAGLSAKDGIVELEPEILHHPAADEVFHAGSRGAVLAFDGITEATLSPDAKLSVRRLVEGQQHLLLEEGEALFRVDPNRQASVWVDAGEARVLVTGTVFRVETGRGRLGKSTTDPSPSAAEAISRSWTKVEVSRGRVDVSYARLIHSLGPGESWSTDAPHDKASTSHAGPGQPETTNANGQPESLSGAKGRRRAAGTAVDRKARQKSADGATTLEGPTTLARENQLFREAVSARNAGSPSQCVALLDELLTRHPRTPLRQEALVARFRCQARSGLGSAAGRAAARYLAEYPRGFAREEARELVLSKD